jgi:endonuclease/exonuclease/phosphatase family metal-dependent hydrolase
MSILQSPNNALPRARLGVRRVERIESLLNNLRPFTMQFPKLLFGLLLGGMITTSLRAEVATNPPLCVMTYNLRYASPTGPNAWPERRPLVREVIQSMKPDVIGTQEGLHAQLLDVAADLPDYNWVGVGRNDGKTNSEFMAVFYLKSRLEALSTNHFWLSDTPEIPGSTTWGNSNRRMVTWLKFRDRATGGEFYFFNTHFDHQVQPAREKSAELVRQRVAALETKLPVLLVGDFNAGAGRNKAFDILTSEGFFSDSWVQAKERRNDGVNSFNSFKSPNWDGQRIDWILTRGDIAVDRTEIVTFSRAGQFPSDHFPVVAWLKLPTVR